MTRRPDGRILIRLARNGAILWLAAEEETPLEAAQMVHFVLRGAAPSQTRFALMPWAEAYAAHPVVTYDDIVPVNRDFKSYVLQETRRKLREYRARRAAEDRIPPRRRRLHRC